MKKILIILGILSLSVFAYGVALSGIVLPDWEVMPIYNRAEIMLQTKAEANKSEAGAENYMNIQTIISLSAPLTAEQNKELIKDASAILQKHPEWGNIKPPPLVQKTVIIDEPKAALVRSIQEEISQTKSVQSTPVIAKEITQDDNEEINVVDSKSKIQSDASNQDQQNNLNEVLKKYNEQKKLIITPDLKEIVKIDTPVMKDNNDDTNLFADGDFPTGQFYETKHLDGMPYTKEFKSTYYLIEPLIIDYPINGSYICHLDESFGTDVNNLFFSEKRQFLVTFPFPTPYLKRDSTVFFTLTYPLTIKGKVKYKDTAGDLITKYICEYQGKSLHSIK